MVPGGPTCRLEAPGRSRPTKPVVKVCTSRDLPAPIVVPMTEWTATARLVENNRRYAESRVPTELPPEPAQSVVIVTCMDARIDPAAALGLSIGDAHVLRNAGGVITDDVIRSIVASQRSLGTREILLIHHTRCGLAGVDEDAFMRAVKADTGERPSWRLYAFADVRDNVRHSLRLVSGSPFIPHRDQLRGFVYDVDRCLLEEIFAE